MKLIRCEGTVCHANSVHRCTYANRLCLRPLHNGAFAPAGHAAFVHCQPPPKDHRRLPLLVECIFNDGKFLPMMCHADQQLKLLIYEIFFLAIIDEVHAPLHVRKSTARHALLPGANCIEGLAGAPTDLDQWQTS